MGSRATRWSMMLGWLLSGCSPGPAVDLQGRCWIEAGPTTVDRSRDGFMLAVFPDRDVVFMATFDVGRSRLGETAVSWDAVHLDWGLTSRLRRFSLGHGAAAFEARWVVSGSAVHGLIPADPSGPDEPPLTERSLTWWSIPAPDDGEPQTSAGGVRTTRIGCWPCDPIVPGRGVESSGMASLHAALGPGGGPLAMFAVVTRECAENDDRYRRLVTARPSLRDAESVAWGEEMCSPTDWSQAITHVRPYLAGGALHALVRTGSEARLAHIGLQQVGPDQWEVVHSPTVVGAERPPVFASPPEEYLEPSVVEVGDRVLFTDRDGAANRCYTLRTMNRDGTSSRAAPWQLPCESDDRITTVAELVRVNAELAAIVWDEQPSESATDPGFARRIRIAMLTAEGRRASPVLELTRPEWGSGGPALPVGWHLRAAGDGEGRVAVAFDAPTAPTPGLAAVAVRCEQDTP